MSDFEPGVYSGVVKGERIVLMRKEDEPFQRPFLWHSSTAAYADYQVTDVRPLVVLDLDERNASTGYDHAGPRWLRSMADADDGGGRATVVAEFARWLADQIEAQTKPPRPDEPTGLGAVVVDEADEDEGDSLRWTRTSGPMVQPGNAMWISEHGQSRDWAAFRRPVVKSPGWSE